MKLVSSGNKDKRNNIPQNRSGAVNGNTALSRNPAVANQNGYKKRQPTGNRPALRNSPAAGNRPAASASPVTQNQKGRPDKNLSTKAKPAPKKKSPVKVIIIILMILLIGVAALVVSLAFYVESLDTVFPNVWAEGFEVSGLTFEEAKQALIDAGYQNNADGIYVTIEFPDESSFTFSGGEVGLNLNAEEAAIVAFQYGRTDTFFRNLITYVESLFERTDLTNLSTPVFDNTIMRSLAAEYTEKFNKTIIHGELEHNERAITIRKGMGILELADANELFKLASDTLELAVAEHDHITAQYIPERDTENNLDMQIQMLNTLFDEIHEDAKNVVYEFDMDVEGYVTIIAPEADGRTFDLEEAKERLQNAAYGESIVIYIDTLEPDYTADDVKGLIFRDILSEVETTMSNNSNRTNNIRLAARSIDETILKPGEVFSFNGVVGQRTAERGFLTAPGYRGGELVDMRGGGICQAASTLYYAVLLTQLEIVQRTSHGMIVRYMPVGSDKAANWPDGRQGIDATVSWGNLDFKFKNNTEFPIKIQTGGSGNKLIFRLIGTKIDTNITDVEVELKWRAQPTSSEVLTDELLVGQRESNTPFPGYRVETFRVLKTADGEIIERKSLGISSYRLINRVTRIGTGVEEAPPPVTTPPTTTPPVTTPGEDSSTEEPEN